MRSTVATTAAPRQASMVAAVPIAQRHCFQAVGRVAAPAQRLSAGRASVKAQAAATLEAGADAAKLPAGYHLYETMMILKPSLSDEERDREMAKFEAYLNKEECFNISAIVKPRTRLAYPMKKESDGIYVLYNYCARRQTARAVQLLLSNPEAGAEDIVLRHITLCKS